MNVQIIATSTLHCLYIQMHNMQIVGNHDLKLLGRFLFHWICDCSECVCMCVQEY